MIYHMLILIYDFLAHFGQNPQVQMDIVYYLHS
jgi:hypothetical protein